MTAAAVWTLHLRNAQSKQKWFFEIRDQMTESGEDDEANGNTGSIGTIHRSDDKGCKT